MTNHTEWNYAKEDLIRAVTALGLPESLAILIAKQLGSPKAIRRMTSYLWQAKPKTAEEVVDEMLAIESEIEVWREKKSNEEASEKYYRMLRSRPLDEEE
ncbi:MAG: hypothetical protein K6F44_01130 [Lachnospiraceae bacterium]|nr:hypothetical protein [Lachnospiraceae bacterium]